MSGRNKTPMEIHFKSAHTKDIEEEVTPPVISIAQRKLIALKKYLGKTDSITQVYVELGKSSEAHVNGNVWRAQINLDFKGKRYHADSQAERIRTAIDIAVKEIETELRKAKLRNKSMIRQGGAAVKSFMRGFSAK
jgi:ribosomal subunit interface protein